MSLNLTSETIEALRAQGVPAEAVLDALEAALKARIERDRENARLRQQKSRAARRPRRVSTACHSDRRDPSLSPPKEVPPNPPKKYNPSNLTQGEPPSSAPDADEAASATVAEGHLPDDWKPDQEHVLIAIRECSLKLDDEVHDAAIHEGLHPVELVETFARRYCEERAVAFRAWAKVWKRKSPQTMRPADFWTLRFMEWLRIDFSRLGRNLPTLTVPGTSRAATNISINEWVGYEVRRHVLDREENDEARKAECRRRGWPE